LSRRHFCLSHRTFHSLFVCKRCLPYCAFLYKKGVGGGRRRRRRQSRAVRVIWLKGIFGCRGFVGPLFSWTNKPSKQAVVNFRDLSNQSINQSNNKSTKLRCWTTHMLHTLPADVLCLILHPLPVRRLFAVSRTCRALRQCAAIVAQRLLARIAVFMHARLLRVDPAPAGDQPHHHHDDGDDNNDNDQYALPRLPPPPPLPTGVEMWMLALAVSCGTSVVVAFDLAASVAPPQSLSQPSADAAVATEHGGRRRRPPPPAQPAAVAAFLAAVDRVRTSGADKFVRELRLAVAEAGALFGGGGGGGRRRVTTRGGGSTSSSSSSPAAAAAAAAADDAVAAWRETFEAYVMVAAGWGCGCDGAGDDGEDGGGDGGGGGGGGGRDDYDEDDGFGSDDDEDDDDSDDDDDDDEGGGGRGGRWNVARRLQRRAARRRCEMTTGAARRRRPHAALRARWEALTARLRGSGVVAAAVRAVREVVPTVWVEEQDGVERWKFEGAYGGGGEAEHRGAGHREAGTVCWETLTRLEPRMDDATAAVAWNLCVRLLLTTRARRAFRDVAGLDGFRALCRRPGVDVQTVIGIALDRFNRGRWGKVDLAASAACGTLFDRRVPHVNYAASAVNPKAWADVLCACLPAMPQAFWSKELRWATGDVQGWKEHAAAASTVLRCAVDADALAPDPLAEAVRAAVAAVCSWWDSLAELNALRRLRRLRRPARILVAAANHLKRLRGSLDAGRAELSLRMELRKAWRAVLRLKEPILASMRPICAVIRKISALLPADEVFVDCEMLLAEDKHQRTPWTLRLVRLADDDDAAAQPLLAMKLESCTGVSHRLTDWDLHLQEAALANPAVAPEQVTAIYVKAIVELGRVGFGEPLLARLALRLASKCLPSEAAVLFQLLASLFKSALDANSSTQSKAAIPDMVLQTLCNIASRAVGGGGGCGAGVNSPGTAAAASSTATTTTMMRTVVELSVEALSVGAPVELDEASWTLIFRHARPAERAAMSRWACTAAVRHSPPDWTWRFPLALFEPAELGTLWENLVGIVRCDLELGHPVSARMDAIPHPWAAESVDAAAAASADEAADADASRRLRRMQRREHRKRLNALFHEWYIEVYEKGVWAKLNHKMLVILGDLAVDDYYARDSAAAAAAPVDAAAGGVGAGTADGGGGEGGGGGGGAGGGGRRGVLRGSRRLLRSGPTGDGGGGGFTIAEMPDVIDLDSDVENDGEEVMDEDRDEDEEENEEDREDHNSFEDEDDDDDEDDEGDDDEVDEDDDDEDGDGDDLPDLLAATTTRRRRRRRWRWTKGQGKDGGGRGGAGGSSRLARLWERVFDGVEDDRGHEEEWPSMIRHAGVVSFAAVDAWEAFVRKVAPPPQQDAANENASANE
ncbi:hypothetical protein DFJ73DRAFT_933939, partial [Zopfochytrium polystomum]